MWFRSSAPRPPGRWKLFVALLVVMQGVSIGEIIRVPGDIMLGGIFPVHEQNQSSGACGYGVKEEKGIQRLEAMLYAIDEINKNKSLLPPGVDLGAVILDSCSSAAYALEQSMEFVRSYMNKDPSEYRCPDGSTPIHEPHLPVTGVIGASFSVVSIMVANILRLFEIPQISYASTSSELSDKSRFGYFSRVVPPDNMQAKAMVDVVSALGWKYVSTVAVEGDYGERGIQSFVSKATEVGICVGVSELITRKASDEDFKKMVKRLREKKSTSNVTIIVMFVDEDNIRRLLQAAAYWNFTEFVYVASDSWGAKTYPVKEVEYFAEGAITILPQRKHIPAFDDYFLSLRPVTDNVTCSNTTPIRIGNITINCRNAWFKEFWYKHHKCNETTCIGNETLRNSYQQEGLVPFVVDAVYAMAHALHHLINATCKDVPSFSNCTELKQPYGRKLLEYIRNVSFTGRQDQDVSFDSSGDAPGSYQIYQYQRKDKDTFSYELLGSWKDQSLNLSFDKARWKLYGGKPLDRGQPEATCSQECPIGHVKNFLEACCWACMACYEREYVDNDTCKACPTGHAPEANRKGCYKIVPTVLGWDSPWAYVPLGATTLGILLTIFTLAVFMRFNSTPVIMASGRELCYVLLLGAAGCFVTPILFLSRPSAELCFAARLMPGLALSICYSAILTKTNRISRIFNARSTRRPACTSPRSQVAICMGLVMIQVIISGVWIFFEPPSVQERQTAVHVVLLVCAESTESLMTSLMFNFFLILLCTLYAFKTRKIPENFNEAKYISFTMYSTCIVWLSFVPIYFGTKEHAVQTASLCMCLEISAVVVLGCLFAPKAYIVIFQPYKNVRQNHMHKPRSARYPGASTGPHSSLHQQHSSLPSSTAQQTSLQMTDQPSSTQQQHSSPVQQQLEVHQQPECKSDDSGGAIPAAVPQASGHDDIILSPEGLLHQQNHHEPERHARQAINVAEESSEL